jgi:PAS domain S-box-containing protein
MPAYKTVAEQKDSPMDLSAYTFAFDRGRARLVRSAILRYGLSVVCVAIALGLALGSELSGTHDLELPVFELAIVFVAWFAGLGPSIAAVVLSCACFTYFFTEPRYTFEVSTADLPGFSLFIAWAIIVASFVNVRRRVEADLRATRDRLQIEVEQRAQQARILDQTHDAILVREMNGAITFWNRGAEERYGWRRDEALGNVTHTLLQTRFPESLAVINQQILLTDRWEGELVHTTRDGSSIIVATRWALQRDDQRRPIAIIETNNDITARKSREDEVRKLNQELATRAAELEASNKELESFAYSVSHDLRAPLRHVAGYSELLQRHASTLLDEKSRRYIQTIVESSQRMGNLIDDLLSFSRIGRAETKKTQVSLEQLVREVVAEVDQDANGRDIAWKIAALPVCYGDRPMLKLVIANLLSNAVKFTRMQPLATIEIGCVDANQDQIEIFVRDNGAGFDMQYANKLFGVFQRLHRAEEFEGTGIGLATVQRIINRHGGMVRAEGAVDQGATVYFSLSKAHSAAERTANSP